MTNCYNFALKIETSWAKEAVKPILETWKANDVFGLKLQYKKSNSTCTKFYNKQLK